MSPLPRVRSTWVAAVLCAVSILGCSKSSSHPTAPTPPTERQVAVTVEDSTGAAVGGVLVTAFGIDDATGIATVGTEPADAAGVASFTLIDGHWSMFARVTPYNASARVAGSTGIVGPRPAPDTVLFRLVLRTQSVARGKVTLNGQTAYGGTFVGVLEFPAFTQTDTDGSYELDGLPPGSWTGLVEHLGFQPGQFTLVVPAPGDTVAVGTVALPPAPVP